MPYELTIALTDLPLPDLFHAMVAAHECRTPYDGSVGRIQQAIADVARFGCTSLPDDAASLYDLIAAHDAETRLIHERRAAARIRLLKAYQAAVAPERPDVQPAD